MAKKKELSIAECFYIEHNKDKDISCVAKDLKVSEDMVREYLEKIKKEVKNSPETAGFAIRDGTVSMTQGASEKSDDIRKKEKEARESGTLPKQKVPKNAFLIDPTKPIR